VKNGGNRTNQQSDEGRWWSENPERSSGERANWRTLAAYALAYEPPPAIVTAETASQKGNASQRLCAADVIKSDLFISQRI
jgi:hypothetical protein